MSNIKTMLENDNYIIILDTNVLLNIYRYSPEFSEFALECLNKVNNLYIYLQLLEWNMKSIIEVNFQKG